MTTLADVRKGNVFLVGVRCTDADAVTGLAVTLYGPGRSKMATGQIAPNGTITGTLVTAANLTQVQLVTGFAPIDVGDVLQNDDTGETFVARRTHIKPNGVVLWSASPVAGKAMYSSDGWSVVGHLNLST